jgi:hypothetical protein
MDCQQAYCKVVPYPTSFIIITTVLDLTQYQQHRHLMVSARSVASTAASSPATSAATEVPAASTVSKSSLRPTAGSAELAGKQDQHYNINRINHIKETILIKGLSYQVELASSHYDLKREIRISTSDGFKTTSYSLISFSV